MDENNTTAQPQSVIDEDDPEKKESIMASEFDELAPSLDYESATGTFVQASSISLELERRSYHDLTYHFNGTAETFYSNTTASIGDVVRWTLPSSSTAYTYRSSNKEKPHHIHSIQFFVRNPQLNQWRVNQTYEWQLYMGWITVKVPPPIAESDSGGGSGGEKFYYWNPNDYMDSLIRIPQGGTTNELSASGNSGGGSSSSSSTHYTAFTCDHVQLTFNSILGDEETSVTFHAHGFVLGDSLDRPYNPCGALGVCSIMDDQLTCGNTVYYQYFLLWILGIVCCGCWICTRCVASSSNAEYGGGRGRGRGGRSRNYARILPTEDYDDIDDDEFEDEYLDGIEMKQRRGLGIGRFGGGRRMWTTRLQRQHLELHDATLGNDDSQQQREQYEDFDWSEDGSMSSNGTNRSPSGGGGGDTNAAGV